MLETGNWKNAPSLKSMSVTVNGYTVAYGRHHVITSQAMNTSEFLSALSKHGLFNHSDYRINGLSLPYTINGEIVTKVPGRTDIVGGAAHTGGHGAYNRMQLAVFEAFDVAYQEAASSGWGQFGSERAWLTAHSGKVYGFIGFLKAELINPNSVLKLHGSADWQRSELFSGELWNNFASTFFDAETLTFNSEISSHPAYLALSSANGLNDVAWNDFSANPNSGSPFDITTNAAPAAVSEALHDAFGMDPNVPTIFETARVTEFKAALGTAPALLLAAWGAGLYLLAAQHAEAHEISVGEALLKLGADVSEEQLHTIAAEAGIDLAASALLGPLGAAKKTWDILSSTDDAIGTVKIYDHLYPDNPAVSAVSDLAYAIEASDSYQIYKEARDAGVDNLKSWPEFIQNWLETEGQAHVLALAAAGVTTTDVSSLDTLDILQAENILNDHWTNDQNADFELNDLANGAGFDEIMFSLETFGYGFDYGDYDPDNLLGIEAWHDYYMQTAGSTSRPNGCIADEIDPIDAAGSTVLCTIYVEAAPPVVLDLDGDGIELVHHTVSNVYFDMDGDRYKEQTGWVAPDDGLLVIDLGNDGAITDRKEFQFALWGSNTTSDFDGLRQAFDTNKNGKLDSGDARFSEFKVWRDLNQNGLSDPGELQGLSSASIAAISLNSNNISYELAGNKVLGESSYLLNDGTIRTVSDVQLTHKKEGYITVSHDQFTRSWQGYSFSDNLFYTFSQSTIRPVYDYYYFALALYKSLLVESNYRLDFGVSVIFWDLMQGWFSMLEGQIWINNKLLGGADGPDIVEYRSSSSTGDVVDFHSALFSLNKVVGGDGNDHFTLYTAATVIGGAGNDVLIGGIGENVLVGGAGSDQLIGGSGNDHLYFDSYDTVVRGGGGNDVAVANGDIGIDFDVGISDIDVIYGTTKADHILNSSAADSMMNGGDGNDTLEGGSGSDVLLGDNGADIMRGRDGNDLLQGGDGDDALWGGAGNDELTGGSGSDTFHFSFLDGRDLITDFDTNEDIIVLHNMKSNVSTYQDLMALGVETSSGVIFELDNDNSIYFLGQNLSDFSQSNFDISI